MEYLPVILPSIAVIIAVFTFIILHVLPAKFKIEHISRKKKNSNLYEHIITIVNLRYKTGILKGIEPITSSKKASVKRTKVEVIWGERLANITEESPYAVVAVGEKEAIVIKCQVTIVDLNKKHIVPKYKIKLTLDKSTKFIYGEEDENLVIGYKF